MRTASVGVMVGVGDGVRVGDAVGVNVGVTVGGMVISTVAVAVTVVVAVISTGGASSSLPPQATSANATSTKQRIRVMQLLQG